MRRGLDVASTAPSKYCSNYAHTAGWLAISPCFTLSLPCRGVLLGLR